MRVRPFGRFPLSSADFRSARPISAQLGRFPLSRTFLLNGDGLPRGRLLDPAAFARSGGACWIRRRSLRQVMSAETVLELVRRYYEAFNAGDDEGMVALVTEDVVHDINQGGTEVGSSAFRAFLGRMRGSYREELRDLVFYTSVSGQGAAAEYVVHGQYLKADRGLPAAHGQTYVLPGGAFFSVRGGKISRITNYYNLEDWLKQVG
jgi:steroid delta-isomerase-like uncharacterized protein